MSTLSWSLRKKLYQQASAHLANGLTLSKTLAEFRERLEQRGKAKAADAAFQVEQRVSDGSTFMEALGDGITDLERSVLDAGERSGALADAMKRILEVREMTGRLTTKLQASLFAPAVYIVTLYVVLFIIGHSINPQFLDVLPLHRWTDWAYSMYWMGELAVGWPAPVLFGSIAGYFIWAIYSLPRWTGEARTWFDAHLFPFTTYKEIQGTTWLLAFVTLRKAGVSEEAAIEGQIETATPWMASRLQPILTGLVDGLDLATAMREAGHEFPAMDLIDDVKAFAGFGDFTEKISEVITAYVVRLERMLLLKGTALSLLFSGLSFGAFTVLQLGSNSLSSALSSSMGQF